MSELDAGGFDDVVAADGVVVGIGSGTAGAAIGTGASCGGAIAGAAGFGAAGFGAASALTADRR